MTDSHPGPAIERLRQVVASLRDPEEGCPWDLKQDHMTLRRYLVEESYELLEAIEANNDALMREELGDVLLQVAFHAQLADERGAFTLEDVIDGIADKMVERHPHVFGDETARDADQVLENWERAKQKKGKRVLDGVPAHLPALHRAHRLTKKAATVGFDWPDPPSVFGKIREELDELEEAVATGSRDRIEDELGDLIFALANLGRKLDIPPEDALRRTLSKFERRFRHVEDRLAEQGRKPHEATLDEMDELWREAKSFE